MHKTHIKQHKKNYHYSEKYAHVSGERIGQEARNHFTHKSIATSTYYVAKMMLWAYNILRINLFLMHYCYIDAPISMMQIPLLCQ